MAGIFACRSFRLPSYATTAPEKLPPRVCDWANSQYRFLNVVHAYGLSTTSAYLSALAVPGVPTNNAANDQAFI